VTWYGVMPTASVQIHGLVHSDLSGTAVSQLGDASLQLFLKNGQTEKSYYLKVMSAIFRAVRANEFLIETTYSHSCP
jgi:hypothetical protein